MLRKLLKRLRRGRWNGGTGRNTDHCVFLRAYMAEWLNQEAVEQMETQRLIGWRDDLAADLARITVYISQIDYALAQRDPKEAA